MLDSRPFRVLSLDGGGAKGFYTLGLLKGIEAQQGRKICESFDLIYGTSTGAIIATLLALGYSVDEVTTLYREHVVKIMARWLPWQKSAALSELATNVFADKSVSDFRTGIGIVCTNWDTERPLIFKAAAKQAFGGRDSFVPFFGVPIADAVQASCSAYPFFSRKLVQTSDGDTIRLADGGYCANNPTLYAIVEATVALKLPPESIRLVSLGVGEYPVPKKSVLSPLRYAKYLFFARLLQTTLEINTQSMEQLRSLLFDKTIATVRISNKYTQPQMATDLFEHDGRKLDQIWRRGKDSFLEFESQLKSLLN
jgi:predicted acylesterase/phospholipase RssA